MIGFPSGAIAHAHLSWLAPSKLRTTTVIGSQKMVIYDDNQSVEKVKIYDQGVDKLEIDELRRSYRAGDIHSPRIAMTEALGLNVIAEGVETREQFEFLDLRGCHAFQGYLFSKPVPLAQFEAALRGK